MSQASVQEFLTTTAGAGSWMLDPEASSVRVAHRTMWGLLNVKGRFTRVVGHGEVGPDGSVAGVLTVDAASIDTGNAKRDKHLRGPEFFDAERHPEFTVRVTGGAPQGDGVEFRSELLIRGAALEMPLTATVGRLTGDAVTLTVETTVDRARFGMNWNQMGMIRGLTTVTVEAVFRR